MRIELPSDGLEFGRTLASAFVKAGGVNLARAAFADPAARERVVLPILELSGVLEVDAREGLDELTAVASASRAAGSVALPYPLVGLLAAPVGMPGVLFVSRTALRAEHGDLAIGWTAVTADGSRATVVSSGGVDAAITSRFTTAVAVDSWAAGDLEPAVLVMLLDAWSILGSLETALSLTLEHSRLREQFGHRISDYQGIQFQLADAFVELSGLEVMCEQALHAYFSAGLDSLTDVLALRVSMLEAADRVLKVCHQVHAAVGFTDEHDLSWLSRYGQLVRRSPVGSSGTLAWLSAQIEATGFDSLFPVPGFRGSGVAHG
ncbi:MAG: acrC 5 [Microbacteriaceae bacterium]|nr:acrC 5 [Microbacteriaceae bacterium]